MLAALVATFIGVSAGLVWLIGVQTVRHAGPPRSALPAPPEVPAESGRQQRVAELPTAPEASLSLECAAPASTERSARAPSTPTPALERENALRASSNPRERFEGLRLLAARHPREALPELLDFLEATRGSKPALLQRITAVGLLGELEGISTQAELFALYQEDEPGVRRAAAKALEAQGDASLVLRELDGLRAGLANPDGGLRARAAEETAQLASPVAIPALLPLLADENSEVRAHAIDGLWLADDPTLLPELQGMLADPVERVRERARRAIQALSANAAARRL